MLQAREQIYKLFFSFSFFLSKNPNIDDIAVLVKFGVGIFKIISKFAQSMLEAIQLENTRSMTMHDEHPRSQNIS